MYPKIQYIRVAAVVSVTKIIDPFGEGRMCYHSEPVEEVINFKGTWHGDYNDAFNYIKDYCERKQWTVKNYISVDMVIEEGEERVCY